MIECFLRKAKKYGRKVCQCVKGACFKGASAKQLSTDDIIIVIVGPTGSGKSTFMDTITGGKSGIGVGHKLESCTSEISTIRLAIPGLTHGDLVLVDTPGFDDTKKSDVDILNMIAEWLKSTYTDKIVLAGLLYFHRITDNRMTGIVPLKNLHMFKELCGEDVFQDQNVILVTTMWGEIAEEEGKTQEQKLKSKYWRTMSERGSTTSRFMQTRESALSLVYPFIEAANKRFVDLLQEEMVDMRGQLPAASAGHQLYSKLEPLVKQCLELLDRIRNEMKHADSDEMALEAFQLAHEKLRINLEATVKEMQELKLPLGRCLVKMAEKSFHSHQSPPDPASRPSTSPQTDPYVNVDRNPPPDQNLERRDQVVPTKFKGSQYPSQDDPIKGQATGNNDSATESAKNSRVARSHQSPPDSHSTPHTSPPPTDLYVNVDREPPPDQNLERRDQVAPTEFKGGQSQAGPMKGQITGSTDAKNSQIAFSYGSHQSPLDSTSRTPSPLTGPCVNVDRDKVQELTIFEGSQSHANPTMKGHVFGNTDAKNSQIALGHSHRPPPDSTPCTPSPLTGPCVNVDREPLLDQNVERRDQVEPTRFEADPLSPPVLAMTEQHTNDGVLNPQRTSQDKLIEERTIVPTRGPPPRLTQAGTRRAQKKPR